MDEIFGVKCNTLVLENYLPGIETYYGPEASCNFNLSIVSPLDMEFQAGDVFFTDTSLRLELLFK
jgi:hypothetical protein